MTVWKEAQKILIIDAIELCGGNKSYAAKYLGISIRTVRKKIIEFNLRQYMVPVSTRQKRGKR